MGEVGSLGVLRYAQNDGRNKQRLETNNGWKQTTAEQMTAGTNKGNSKDNSKRNGNSKRRSSAVRRMTAKNEQRQHRVTSRKPGTQD
jgi:hypothetical protein